MIPTLEEICKVAKKHPLRVHGCYIFGSRVYGTSNYNSDWDIILICNSSSPEVEINQTSTLSSKFKGKELNIHLIVPDKFKQWSKVNHIKAIECLFAPDWAIIKKFDCDFKLSEKSLIHNISHSVSNSWVKSKKKLEQGDYYIGIKSIFHSLRIAQFGIEFVKYGKINFDVSNQIWSELNSKKWNWGELQEKYQPTRNKLMTEFRTLVRK